MFQWCCSTTINWYDDQLPFVVVGDQFLCVVVTGLQHSHLQPAVDVRQASNTSLPLSGGKMLFLGVPQMLLATFNFCSVSLMIIFNYHLLFYNPPLVACRLLPPPTTMWEMMLTFLNCWPVEATTQWQHFPPPTLVLMLHGWLPYIATAACSLKKKQKTIKINWALKEKSQNHPGLPPWCWAVAFLGCEWPPTINLWGMALAAAIMCRNALWCADWRKKSKNFQS